MAVDVLPTIQVVTITLTDDDVAVGCTDGLRTYEVIGLLEYARAFVLRQTFDEDDDDA